MKIAAIICVTFILLLVFGLCKISGEYDDEVERQRNKENKGDNICE